MPVRKRSPRRFRTGPSRRYRQKALNQELDDLYQSLCHGLGIHAVRASLSAAPESDALAKALLLALETEIANRRAKRLKGQRGQQLYQQKRKSIDQLTTLCQEQAWPVYLESCPDETQPDIIYIYLPECGQISWHGAFQHLGLDRHPGGWDGQAGTTLRKLERGISSWMKQNGRPQEEDGHSFQST